MDKSAYSSPSLFDSYNARWTPADVIAKTFVPPEPFQEICKPCSQTIVGPRGSGKTSILKMLQTTALENWEDKQADKVREVVSYTSVFIASDVMWSKQYKALGASYLCEEQISALKNGVFCGQVLKALLKAMNDRIEPIHPLEISHRRIPYDPNLIETLINRLSRIWNVTSSVPTFESFIMEIEAELNNIFIFSNRERHLGDNGRKERFSDYTFINLDPFEAIFAGIECFNQIFNEPNGMWALLFDELEIAPKWLTERLFQLLRSSMPCVIFKLSLSPYTPMKKQGTSSSAMSDHDFTIVPLQYKHKSQNIIFAEKLFKNLVKSKFEQKKIDSVKILGASRLNGGEFNEEGKRAYAKNSKRHQFINKICSKDSSVRSYFIKLGFDLENLVYREEHNPLLRKILPTLILREFFLKERNNVQEKRGRKTYSIYSGTDTFFSATESNPRWLIGNTSKLIDKLDFTRNPHIPKHEQAKRLFLTSESFVALLRTIPLSDESDFDDKSLLDLIDRIGDYFHSLVVGPDFIPEPSSSFVVDADVSSEIKEALGVALNAGAIVYLPPMKGDPDFLLNDLSGKKFRLSYLLSQYYRINTRIGPSVPLSKILNPSTKKPKSKDSNQIKLSF